MTLEDKILAYLDGSLDEESSAELLHSLSVSPEKRAMLDEHLRLRNILALGQKPFSIPVAAERAVATRIPALANQTELASRMVRRSALSVLFAGGSEWMAGASGWITGASKWVAGVSESITGLFESPAVRWSAGSVSIAAIGVMAWLLSTSHPTSPVAHNSISSDVPAMIAPNTTPAQSNLHSGANATMSAQSDRSVSRNQYATLHTSAPGSVVNGARLTQGASNSTSYPETSGVGPEAAIATASENKPLNGTVSLVSDLHSTATNVLPSARPARLQDLRSPSVDDGSDLSVSFTYAQYEYELPGVGNVVTASSAHPELALAYSLSPSFALRAECGSTSHPAFSTVARNERLTSISGQSYSRTSYATEVQSSDALFSRLGFEYILNPGGLYEIRLTTSGGVQYAATLLPIASVSAGFTHAISSLLALDMSLVGTGTWGHSSEVANVLEADASTGAVGVVHSDVNIGKTIFSTGYGVRAGLRYQF
jgi:hypothetical protein